MHFLKQEKNVKNILFSACLVVIAAELLTFFMVTYFGRITNCSMDMYADELVAQLIWEKKSVFPENWVFGNQYNVISTPVVMALFYGLTHSLSAALVLACMTMNLLLVGAFVWALRPFCSRVQISLGLAMLMGCVICSPALRYIEGHYHFIMANYYACYVIVMLVVWGDWARLVSGKRKKIFSPSFLLSAVLCFLIGMHSIRQFLMMILPLAAVDLLRLLILLITQRGRLHRDQLKPTVASLCFGVLNLLGLVYVNSLNLPHSTIYGSGGIRPVSQWASMLPACGEVALQITGLPNLMLQENLLPTPIVVLSFCLWLLIVTLVLSAVIIAFVSMFRHKTLFTQPIDLLVLLGFVSFLGVLAAKVVVEINVLAVYIFVWYPLVAFSAISVFLRLKGKGKPILTVLACLLVLNNLVYTYSLAFLNALHVDEGRKEVSDWVVENGYDYMYGDWFTITFIAPYGDGDYIAAGWDYGPFNISTEINITDVYTEEHNKRAVYVVSEKEAAEVDEYLREHGETLDLQYTAADGYFKIYTSDNQLMHWPTP